MDIDLLKTFLEVNKTRHFSRAADNLFITPAAVSARIRQLETSFGVQLFLRQRNNLRLSLEGERLVVHAENLLLAWSRLRQEVGVARESSAEFSLGATQEIWSHVLQPGIAQLLIQLPGVHCRAINDQPAVLSERLLAQTLDLALMTESPSSAELVARRVGQLKLLLICSQSCLTLKQALQNHYVWIDWGTPFELFHVRKFGDQPLPILRTNLSGVALAYLQQCPAAAYLPESVLGSAQGCALQRVKGAPLFHWPVYAVYRASHPREALIENVLRGVTSLPALSGRNAISIDKPQLSTGNDQD